MSRNPETHRSIPCYSRREFLWHHGGGLGGIALASLLAREGLLAGPGQLTGRLHHAPRAKRVVHGTVGLTGAPCQGSCRLFPLSTIMGRKCTDTKTTLKTSESVASTAPTPMSMARVRKGQPNKADVAATRSGRFAFGGLPGCQGLWPGARGRGKPACPLGCVE